MSVRLVRSSAVLPSRQPEHYEPFARTPAAGAGRGAGRSAARQAHEIVGDSPLLRDALERVDAVADTDSTVLLLGETGTGKELFARAVHERSRRRERPFVRVNCAALPASLIETELFGHERGAFTGAVATRQGRFELADKGTLFLDEIGDLPLDVQATLLRVLEEGEFERVGSSQTRRVDVRVVAATHRNLEAAVEAGRFREDLYYRLSVFLINLPPLRLRREDIPRLVWCFIERRQRQLNRHIERIERAVMAVLQEHTWPGNVRELENVIERALIRSRTGVLELDESPATRPREAILTKRTRSKPSSGATSKKRCGGATGVSTAPGMPPTCSDSTRAPCDSAWESSASCARRRQRRAATGRGLRALITCECLTCGYHTMRAALTSTLAAAAIVLALAIGEVGAQSTPQTAPPAGPADARALANQVNNPAAPVTLIQFRDVLLPSVDGADGATNEFQIQPVLPLGPFASFPVLQLIKITLPFPTLPSPISGSGVGDLQVFDLVSIKESWGRWGFGPALVFPTASARRLGQGKWQAGPAVAFMYTGVMHLTAGAILQNPLSFAGGHDRADINNLIITPTLTYNLPDGWFAGLSDFNCTFDWKNDGAATIVLGAQVGRVFSVDTHGFSLSFEAGGAVTRPNSIPRPGWILGFEFSPIFKGHIE